MSRLDGLDATRVVVLNKNATTIGALNQGKIIAVDRDGRILRGEGINIKAQKVGNRFRLA